RLYNWLHIVIYFAYSLFFFFSSRRRHTRSKRDWSSDVCSSDLGFGLYAVEEKTNNEFIGFIGFHRATFEADFTPCIEIGWRLKKEAWGKGYATEGAASCLKYGFTVLN